MIKVIYDSERNTIIAEFSGKIDVAQAEQFYADIQKTVPQCGKGFKLLTDLSAVETVDLKIQGAIKKVMDFLNQRGVAEILRVIPDPAVDIGLNIMSRFHYSKDVQFLTLQSREEALARLS